MNIKQLMPLVLVLLILAAAPALANDAQEQPQEPCNFWCKFTNLFGGENIAGQASSAVENRLEDITYDQVVSEIDEGGPFQTIESDNYDHLEYMAINGDLYARYTYNGANEIYELRNGRWREARGPSLTRTSARPPEQIESIHSSRQRDLEDERAQEQRQQEIEEQRIRAELEERDTEDLEELTNDDDSSAQERGVAQQILEERMLEEESALDEAREALGDQDIYTLRDAANNEELSEIQRRAALEEIEERAREGDVDAGLALAQAQARAGNLEEAHQTYTGLCEGGLDDACAGIENLRDTYGYEPSAVAATADTSASSDESTSTTPSTTSSSSDSSSRASSDDDHDHDHDHDHSSRVELSSENGPVTPPQNNADITVGGHDYDYVGEVDDNPIYQDVEEGEGQYYAYDEQTSRWRQVDNINDPQNLPAELSYVDAAGATSRLNGNIEQRSELRSAREQGIDFFFAQEEGDLPAALRGSESEDYAELEEALGEELWEELESQGVSMVADEQGNYFGENEEGQRIAYGMLNDETGRIMIVEEQDGSMQILRGNGEQVTRTQYRNGQEVFTVQQATLEGEETYQVQLAQGSSGTLYANSNPFDDRSVDLYATQGDAFAREDPVAVMRQQNGETTTDNFQKNERTIVRSNGATEVYQGRYTNRGDEQSFKERRVTVILGDETGEGRYGLDGEFDRMTFRDQEGTITSMCMSESCFQNPQSPQRYHFRDNDGQLLVCQAASRGDCRNAGSGEAQWQTPDEACQGDNDCSNAVRRVRTQRFLNYEGNGWDVATGQTPNQQIIGGVLELRPGWETLSSWVLPDATAKWREWSEDAFNDLYPSDAITRAVCDYREEHKTQSPGSTSIFIETPSGLVTSVGSITAERSREQVPVSCSEDSPCADNQECSVDGVCYQDGEPVLGHFYKITWGMRASPDNPETDDEREGGSMRFNVGVLRNGQITTYLYEVGGAASASTLSLTRGQADGGVYATYSSADPTYDQACIIISEGQPKDIRGNAISEICADFIESNAGESQWRRANDEQRGTNLRTSDESVSQRQI